MSSKIASAAPVSKTHEQTNIVNDVHSQMNSTVVSECVSVDSRAALVDVVLRAKSHGRQVAIAGGRHAMGGQQFRTNQILIDTRNLDAVLSFDSESGLLEVESGLFWDDLIEQLNLLQQNSVRKWAIAQKQTGGDRLSIGGSLAVNMHGRGLNTPPFVRDIESFTIVNSSGEFLLCDRLRNSELFGLAIGGYGCFGVVYSIKIRLVHRTAVRRTVRLTDASNAVSELENSRSDGATHGDFQFAIDHASPNFLRAGIVSTYKPIENSADSMATQNKLLRKEDWENLLYLAHVDKSTAFEQYSAHYLKTDGQIYWSDTFQLSTYLDGYHSKIDARTLSCHHGTEVISELYVPRRHLDQFLARAAQQLRECGANVIYGTVRLIEADDETFLAWARKSWACTVFNLHVGKTPEQIQSAATAFRMLIDLAIDYGGSYYLTYHRFANAEQLLACYPQIHEFFRLKAKYDPDNLFYSDWLESIARLLNLPISIRSGVRTHFSQAS